MDMDQQQSPPRGLRRRWPEQDHGDGGDQCQRGNRTQRQSPSRHVRDRHGHGERALCVRIVRPSAGRDHRASASASARVLDVYPLRTNWLRREGTRLRLPGARARVWYPPRCHSAPDRPPPGANRSFRLRDDPPDARATSASYPLHGQIHVSTRPALGHQSDHRAAA
jgi:hypothetical protein